MSEEKKVTVELTVYQAAAIRESLFLSTAQDSHEFPSVRTVEIRKVISKLDEKFNDIKISELEAKAPDYGVGK